MTEELTQNQAKVKKAFEDYDERAGDMPAARADAEIQKVSRYAKSLGEGEYLRELIIAKLQGG